MFEDAAFTGVEFTDVDAASVAARQVLRRYFAELADRFPGGFDVEGALAEPADPYTPPRGLFVLAVRDGEPVGCAALHLLDATTAEFKRMWVDPRARGAGLGGRLLWHLEERARAAGRTVAVLDTNGSLARALALYRGRGYREIPRYNDNPYAQHWFRKELGAVR